MIWLIFHLNWKWKRVPSQFWVFFKVLTHSPRWVQRFTIEVGYQNLFPSQPVHVNSELNHNRITTQSQCVANRCENHTWTDSPWCMMYILQWWKPFVKLHYMYQNLLLQKCWHCTCPVSTLSTSNQYYNWNSILSNDITT